VKLNVKFLKKKYGPLPVWGWAIIFAGLIFLLWRHSRNAAAASATGQPSAMSLGTDQAATAPGDMSGSTPGNAGDTGTTDTGTFDSGGLGGGFSGGGDLGGSLDGGQGSTTDTSNSTPAAASLGLTHISGDYWWDPDNHKLIKIPGSGGAKKGSGKKVTPKAKAKKAGKTRAKGKTKVKGSSLVRTHTRQSKNPANKRIMRSPGSGVKARVLPKAQTPKLTPVQRRAIDRAHHPEARPTPVVKPAARRQVRVLPKRPTPPKRRR